MSCIRSQSLVSIAVTQVINGPLYSLGVWHSAVSKHRTLLALGISNPSLGQDVFVAPSAAVIGDVTLGNGSSVWYGAVLRGVLQHPACPGTQQPATDHNRPVGDVNEIRIGSNTNVQDGAILHVAKHNAGGTSKPTVIGDNVTIGLSCGWNQFLFHSLCS